MATNLNIEVSPISRVEGHGDLVIDVKNKRIEKLQFRIPESPRFFEAMLVGRDYSEASHLMSRICGICSVSHTFASIRATEAALGVNINDMILKLRKLVNHGEFLESNSLHVYFLAAPDFLGVGSVLPLLDSNPEIVNIAVNIKKVANDIVRIIGGRAIHPITTVVGGFTKLPSIADLKTIRNMLVALYPDFEVSMKLLKTIKIPDFERETEYLSISSKNEYALYEGNLKSSDGWEIENRDYLTRITEKVVQHSTGKHCRTPRGEYMVGALSRVNNNYSMLSYNAKKYAEELGLKPPCFNTFYINIAQFIELVHCVDDSIRLIDELIAQGLDEKKARVKIKVKSGRGVGIVEAPRGALIHDYTYERNGKISKANLIIPTNMNYANVEKDLEAFIPQIIDKSEDEIRLNCEMLIRAYDPCISCSTHLLNVKLINR